MTLKEAKQSITLSGWHAAILDNPSAERLLNEALEAEQNCLLNTVSTLYPRVQKMIARFWLGKNIDHEFRSLCKTFNDPYEQAQVYLVHGQLLMSKKIYGAMESLGKAFLLATPFLEADEYFTVLKRHEKLAHLVLTKTGSSAQELEELLKEAFVIEKLAGSKTGRVSKNHKDTLG